MDTIFALASAKGKAGVSLLRISGPEAFAAARELVGALPEPRRAGLRAVRFDGKLLDQALVLVFEAGQSFTGDAVVELHLHGSRAVVQSVMAALGGLPGLRMAEAGEFTRQALENGRLDLTQVEGLADLIDAETEMQRAQAQRVLSGAIGKRAEGWRRKLVRIAALIEATIDFADEEVPVDVAPEVLELVGGLIAELSHEVEVSRNAERVRAGFEVAIVGKPNVGKSTLLNRLAGRDVAITSEHAGTTRDVIEVRLDLGGLPVTLLDMAGIRDAADPVERQGVERALSRAAQADMRVFLVDDPAETGGMEPRPGDLVVLAKADLHLLAGVQAVSGMTGEGIERLLAAIEAELLGRLSVDALATRHRHLVAMRAAIEALEAARIEVSTGLEMAELAAAEVRRAIFALDVLVGRLGVEDFLAEIFSSFCIGK